MRILSLNIEQLQVTSFSTGEGIVGDSLQEEDSTFVRGCDTYQFSCGGTCHYTCQSCNPLND